MQTWSVWPEISQRQPQTHHIAPAQTGNNTLRYHCGHPIWSLNSINKYQKTCRFQHLPSTGSWEISSGFLNGLHRSDPSLNSARSQALQISVPGATEMCLTEKSRGCSLWCQCVYTTIVFDMVTLSHKHHEHLWPIQAPVKHDSLSLPTQLPSLCSKSPEMSIIVSEPNVVISSFLNTQELHWKYNSLSQVQAKAAHI